MSAAAALLGALVRIEVVPYAQPLAAPVRTARGLCVVRQGWHVVLHTADGHRGLGDAAPWPGFGSGPDVCAQALGDVAKLEAALPWPSTDAWQARLSTCPPEVAHALCQAHADVCAQRLGVPLAQVLAEGEAPLPKVLVHALVDNAYAARAAVQAGYTAFKVKVGVPPLADEVTRILALRSSLGDAAQLRLDANGAWPVPVAVRAARLFAVASPTWLEQPVAAADVEGLAEVRRTGGVPIAADEALASAEDLERIVAAQAADVVVIKPMFVGGPRAAVALGRRARAAGCTVVVTHALESAVGRTAALHVAAALRCEVACGLQPAPPVAGLASPQVHGGAMALPVQPGLGLGAWLPAGVAAP